MHLAGLKYGRMVLIAAAGLSAALAAFGIRSIRHAASANVGVEAKAHPDSAGKFLHLLDYVAGDYHEAVSGGVIIEQEEYDEQVEFIEKAAKVLGGFPDGPSKSTLSAILARLEKAVEIKADPAAIKSAVSGIRDVLQNSGQVSFSPSHVPDRIRGSELFAANCSQCHGSSGHGDGPAGQSLRPRPADFHDHERMDGKTPIQAFNTVRFGVEGTAMPAFAGLPQQDVWDLAYYVLSLGGVSGAAGTGLN